MANTSNTARKLARGSMLRFLNLVAATLVSILIMPFVVRMLGDRLYGLWTLVAALIGFYGVLDLGLSRATTRYLAGGNIQLHKPNPSTTGPSVPPDEITACGSDDSGLGF